MDEPGSAPAEARTTGEPLRYEDTPVPSPPVAGSGSVYATPGKVVAVNHLRDGRVWAPDSRVVRRRLASADGIPGWLTPAQGRLLWDEAARVAAGEHHALEIGSHQGRSTVGVGHAVRAAGARVIAVDPFVEGRLFGGLTTKQKFERNIRGQGSSTWSNSSRTTSTRVRPTWTRPFSLLYIDGKHDYWTLSDDLRWAESTCHRAAQSSSTTATRRSG